MRLLGFVWPLLFFVPLTELAGRYCWLSGIDPIYHTLVFTHEYMPQILLVFAAFSAFAVVRSEIGARRKLRHLAALAAPTPPAVTTLVDAEARLLQLRIPPCVYLDVAQSFCFTAIGTSGIVLSRGFVSSMSMGELRLVLRHELVHLKRWHPARAVAWRILTSFLLLPGFATIERWQYARREAVADREAAGAVTEGYRKLLHDHAAGTFADSNSVIRWRLDALNGRRRSFRFIWPAIAATIVLVALVSSHLVFMARLPFLLTHHC